MSQALRTALVTRNPASLSMEQGQPFRSAADAWFWTMASLRARRDGVRSRPAGCFARPCQPDDILKSLDGLYRQRRIDLAHARVLRVWGERGVAPDPHYQAERAEAVLWREAMDRLEWPLRVKGIVATIG
jgi:hypothetical protein